MDEVIIYTDGACSGNPGNGGWGAVLIYGDIKKEISEIDYKVGKMYVCGQYRSL